MFHYRTLALLCILPWIWVRALAQNNTRHISTELFNSLEELSRLVDIAYCVGTTGIREPFECLSHCAEFEGLELVSVSVIP